MSVHARYIYREYTREREREMEERTKSTSMILENSSISLNFAVSGS